MADGLHFLDTCSGISTALCGALRAGHIIARYVAVEKEERVRFMASHHIQTLLHKYGPERLPPAAVGAAFTKLPQDMTALQEEHIRYTNLLLCMWFDGEKRGGEGAPAESQHDGCPVRILFSHMPPGVAQQ
jgi:hypothetical protein